MTDTPDSRLRLFLLRRRGATSPQPVALIVGAVSPSHARVAAHERLRDDAWVKDGWTSCEELTPRRAGVVHAIYGGRA